MTKTAPILEQINGKWVVVKMATLTVFGEFSDGRKCWCEDIYTDDCYLLFRDKDFGYYFVHV